MSAAAKRSFAALSIHNYRLYFAGQIASLAGNWMQIVAELWLILQLTDSGAAVGIATALQFAGILFFGALGGALADRFDKRKLLIVTQTAMAAPALALFAFSLAGAAELWVVYALIAVRGLVLAVDNPARQAFVVEMVGRDRVVNAVSLNSIIVHSARIAGPAIAGTLIAIWGVTPCFAVNALTFIAMIAALALMRPSELQSPPEHDGGRPSDRRRVPPRDAHAGVAYAAAADGGTGNPRLQLPGDHAAARPLQLRRRGLLLFAVDDRDGRRRDRRLAADGSRSSLGLRVTAAGAGFFSLAALLAALAPTLPLEMAALVLLGGASVIFAASINTGLQLAAEPHMRGRVMALYSIVFLGSTPIGGPIAGWLSGAVSPRAALVMGGVTAALVTVAALQASRRGRCGGRGEQRPRGHPSRSTPAPEERRRRRAPGELAGRITAEGGGGGAGGGGRLGRRGRRREPASRDEPHTNELGQRAEHADRAAGPGDRGASAGGGEGRLPATTTYRRAEYSLTQGPGWSEGGGERGKREEREEEGGRREGGGGRRQGPARRPSHRPILEKASSRQAGSRSGTAPQADARLRDRLQADSRTTITVGGPGTPWGCSPGWSRRFAAPFVGGGGFGGGVGRVFLGTAFPVTVTPGAVAFHAFGGRAGWSPGEIG